MLPIGSQSNEWPMDKFRAAYKQHQQDGEGQRIAVMLSMGAFSPIHMGHLQMMHQAKSRLERAGFAVLQGWLGLDPDQNIKVARRLGGSFRAHLAELALESEPLLSVSTCGLHHSHTPTQVFVELQNALAKELGCDKATLASKLMVFAVCGGDQAQRVAGCRAAMSKEPIGLCMVEQEGEDVIMEKPARHIYVAEPCQGKVNSLNTSAVWTAIAGGDVAYVAQVLPPKVARLCLAPTDKELEAFPVDLDKMLPRIPDSDWPAEKLMAKLSNVKEDKTLALLVLSAALGPSHKGHLDMLEKARTRLQERGFHVIGQWLSPWNDTMAQQEASNSGLECLSSAFRLRCAELTAAGTELTMVSRWESSQTGKNSMHQVAVKCRETLLNHFPGSLRDKRLCIFHVCGSDREATYRSSEAAAHRDHVGVVVIPQDEEVMILEKPSSLMFVANTAQENAMHSKELRQVISDGNAALATKEMTSAAARFVLAPTSEELEQMQADFKKLGVKPFAAADVAKAKDGLQRTFLQKLGPENQVSVQELFKLLGVLDPSVSEEDLQSLMRATQKTGPYGEQVKVGDFVDWVFASLKA